MGRQHRGHEAAGQGIDDGGRRNAGPAQASERNVDAALLGVARALVDGTPADMVPVLGQVGQVAEIGEGPDHADGLVGAQTGQQLFQRPVGFVVGIAAK